MIKESKLFFIIAETPLHPGSGGEVIGLVDLPIQRERHTNFPKIEASGLKGCIREAFENLCRKKNGKYELEKKLDVLKNKFQNIESEWKEKNEKGEEIEKTDKEKVPLLEYHRAISLTFGPEDIEESRAGSLVFTDARILLFPIKSLKGVFAWVTCPLVLERLKEELKLTNKIEDPLHVDFSTLINTLPQQSNICIDSNIVLEEYTFEVKENKATLEIAEYLAQKIFPSQQNDIYKFWHEKLKKDLVILSDDDFEQFVTSSTEVITRTRVDDVTGTVKSGALWTEEYLPQDTILYSIAMASPVRVEKDDAKGIFKEDTPDKEAKKVLQFFELGIPEIIQIGGNQTIGKGIIRIQILNQEEGNAKRNNNKQT